MQKMLSYVRRAVDHYHMIDEGDRIAVGVSGGKDSLALLVALSQLSRFYPHHFTVVAITLEMGYDEMEGRISCFSPVTYLDRADITLIRPLLYVPEHYVRSFAKRHELPIVHNPCPADGNTKRQEIKDLLKSLEKTMPGVRERIFGAMQRYPLEGWEPDKTRRDYK